MGRVVRLREEAPSTWEEAVGQYLCWKQAQGVRPITLKGHRDVIGQFFRKHPEAWDPGKLKQAVYAFMGEEVKPATYNIRRNYLRQFFSWCQKEGIFPESPLAGFKKRKDEGRVACLDGDTLTRLLTLPDRKTFAGLRDYALICLTLDTGIRPKEAFSLLPSDVSLSTLEVRVRPEVSKTASSRVLPISPTTADAIRRLLATRHPSWKRDVPLFCTCDGTPLRNDTWGDRLQVYGRKLGVRIRPYDLRHSFATWFLRNGGNALALQRVLGHTTLDTTKRYVHLTEGDLREQHALASPLQALLPKRGRVRKAGGGK
ncbi:MAG: site-specific integrase [Bacillota bacterium]|nr:site-specific integrase [Bacillota bacterium]